VAAAAKPVAICVIIPYLECGEVADVAQLQPAGVGGAEGGRHAMSRTVCEGAPAAGGGRRCPAQLVHQITRHVLLCVYSMQQGDDQGRERGAEEVSQQLSTQADA
jgi:hypothetical protein